MSIADILFCIDSNIDKLLIHWNLEIKIEPSVYDCIYCTKDKLKHSRQNSYKNSISSIALTEFAIRDLLSVRL